MSRDPDYVGVTTNEDGDIALTLFFDNGEAQYIYLESEDLCSLIACLMLAMGHGECRTFH
jgi:hypothetical protein